MTTSGTAEVDVLAVAAHPDDAEVGCGGTLALCAARGARVGIADLTSGELSTSGTPELRAVEAASAAELLGVSTRVGVGLPDGSLGTSSTHRDAVVQLLRDLRPRVVLAPYHLDDRHPDHAAAGRLVREAAFLAGLRRLGSGSPHRPHRVYHYMLHHVFQPTFVVDVSAVWDRRTAAVEAYASQFGALRHETATAIAGGGFLEVLASRAAVHGAMVGVARGEAYYAVGPVGLDHLPDLDTAPDADVPVYRSHL